MLNFIEMEENEDIEEVVEAKKETRKPVRKPYTVWSIGNGDEYKLKLKAKNIVNLETQFKCSLLVLIQDGMMPLTTMLKIIGESMDTFHHKLSNKSLMELYDEYESHGGSQTALMTEVLLPLYQVSGFFTVEQTETMSEAMETL